MAYLRSPNELEPYEITVLLPRKIINLLPGELEPYEITVLLPRKVTNSLPNTFSLSSSIGAGLGIISGNVTAGGFLPVSAYAILIFEGTGIPIGYAPIEPGTGFYEFTEVGSGNYAVAIIDGTGAKRAKVLHTILP